MVIGLLLTLAVVWVMAGLTITMVIAAVQGHWYQERGVGLLGSTWWKFLWDISTWPVVTVAMLAQAYGKFGWFNPNRFTQ